MKLAALMRRCVSKESMPESSRMGYMGVRGGVLKAFLNNLWWILAI